MGNLADHIAAAVQGNGSVNDKLIKLVSTTVVGDGSPEGVVTAERGTIYMQRNSTGIPLFIKETGSGSTGWVRATAGLVEEVTMLSPSAASVWTTQPAGLTELRGQTHHRTKHDLSKFTQGRLIVNIVDAGVAGSILRAQYSLDQTTWTYLDGGTGPEVAISAANTLQVSGFVNLAEAAKADVFLRIVGLNGNGVISPSFGNIYLAFK